MMNTSDGTKLDLKLNNFFIPHDLWFAVSRLLAVLLGLVARRQIVISLTDLGLLRCNIRPSLRELLVPKDIPGFIVFLL